MKSHDQIGPETPTRLDLFLTQQHHISRKKCQQAIKNHWVLVNQKPAKAAMVISNTDQIHLTQPLKEDVPELQPDTTPLDYLYEDAHLLVLYKPADLTVHPGKRTETLVNRLLHYPQTLSTIGGKDRPGIVHRLDKDTEGLMVIAKTDKAHEDLKAQFKNRTVYKRYYARVKGNPKSDEIKITNYITRHPKRRNKRCVTNNQNDPQAKDAITTIQVIKRQTTSSLVRVQLHTGRTHQIRVHCAHIGHPVLGDPLYNPDKSQKGLCLQAYALGFQHPITKQQLTFEVPPSKLINHA